MLPQSKYGWMGLVAGALALAALPLAVPSYYVELGTYALIAAMLALSLQLLVGCTGLVSLGHGAFYGLAAYTVYLVTPENEGLSIFVTLPAAVLAAGLGVRCRGAVAQDARLLLPHGDAGVRADGVLSVPRYEDRRRRRRRVPHSASAVAVRLRASADAPPTTDCDLLRRPRANGADVHRPGVPAPLAFRPRPRKVSASTSIACRRWATIPTATSSRPS